MAKEQIAPTKSNLMKVKERLHTALEGYDLLEQKREILVMDLMRQVERVKMLEKDLYARSDTAYASMRRMLITIGRERAEGLSRSITYDYSLREKRVSAAGMTLPSLTVEMPKPVLKYAPGSSFAECDETVLEFFALVRLITELAEVRTVAWRLAREVRRTQRRCNALEKMVIPAAKESKTAIEAALEEKDREAFFSSKLLKKKADKR